MVTVVSFGTKPTISLRNMGATAIVRPYGEKGDKGDPGLPGPSSIPADTAVGGYATTDGTFTANGIDARIDKRMPFTTPEMHGAVGDGTTDDTAALQAAIDALAANGGGRVICSKRHGFKGIVTVKNGVYLEGPATRQGPAMTASPSTPGLLALDNTAQLQVGDWTSNSNPGGVVNLYVDGNEVGAASTAKTGLVRLAGVSTEIRGLFVHRSGGDGIVVDGLQNSTIVGGFSVGHAGAALVLDNGCGGLSFTGGYYGTSKGGTHLCRDTAGQANLYPFGPTNITFTGTMFESYGGQAAPLDEPHARHVHISGRNLTYVGCNFTGGAQNTAAATVLVDDTCTGGIPATVSFDNCIYWARGGYDVVRIAGNSSVAFVGRQESSDDGTNHAASFVCVDGGFPHVAMVGEVLMAGDVDGDLIWRAINSGSMLGTYTEQSGGQVYQLTADQSLGIRATGDTINRYQLEGNGTIRWTDGSGGAIAPHTDGLLLSGRSIFSDGIGVVAETISVTTAAQSVALDAKTSVEWRLSFAATGDGVSALTVANALDGSLLRVGLFGTGVNTMTWATNMSFASTAPQPVDGQAIFVDFEYVATASKWMETGRSTAVADDTEVAALVSASGSATHAALSATYARLSGVQATATASGAVVAGKHNPVDATSGNLTMTLADATDAGQVVVVSKKDATTNTVTLSAAHLRDGGAGSITLVGQYEAITLTSKADGSWWPIGDHKTKAYLDTTYRPRPTARWRDTVVAQHLPVGHRNSYNVYPESTIDGMRAAINAGARVLKFDVQPLADGMFGVIHDTTVNRTTTSTGNTTDFHTTDYQQLVINNATGPVGPGYTATLHPPLLTDVLDTFGGQVTLIIECKTNGTVNIPKVLAAVTARGLADTVMLTGDVTSGTSWIATARAAGCGALIFWNNATDQVPSPSVASIIAAVPDVVGIGLQYSDANIGSVVSAAHAAGIPVASFSINRRSDRDRSISLGVDQIQTNTGPYTETSTALVTKGYISRGLAVPGLTHSNTPIGAGTPTIPDWTGTAGAYAYKLCGLGSGVDYLAMGMMCPIGTDSSGAVSTTSYTITAQVTVDVLDADTTRWPLALVVCAPDDMKYANATGQASGYHCLLRYNGTVDIYRLSAGTITDGVRGTAAGPVQVATQASTALTATQTVTVTVQVTPTQIIFKRTDTGATATATDSTYRGGYLHVGGASTGLGQASLKSCSVA